MWRKYKGDILWGFAMVLILSAALLFRVWYYGGAPETCSLCESSRYYGPCLLNLSTGEMREVKIYESNPSKDTQILTYDPELFYSFFMTGASGGGDSTAQRASIALSSEVPPMEKTLFCKYCRWELVDCLGCSFAIVDRYEDGEVKAYPVFNGASYEMRCYKIDVGKENGKLKITVVGNAR